MGVEAVRMTPDREFWPQATTRAIRMVASYPGRVLAWLKESPPEVLLAVFILALLFIGILLLPLLLH